MKTNKENIEKKTYNTPQLNRIKLDNEISLSLESTLPDTEPIWGKNQESYSNDPYKTNVG